MKKIKVCHVVSGLRAGGVESMIYNYCSKMDVNKIDFSILFQHQPSLKNIKEFEELGFSLINIPNKRVRPLSNFLKTYKYLKNNHIDVVHCHMTLMNIFPLCAAKLARVPKRICHSHGYDVRKKIFIIRLFEKILKRICIRLSTDLFACGEEAGKYLYGKEKFTIVNNALSISKFKFNPEIRKKIRNKYGLKRNDRFILHVARFEEQKNHFFVLDFIEEILKCNKNYKLIFIGDGELRKKVEDVVNKRNIPNIIFAGIVNNVSDFYSACDVFILPSKYEGLPVSALEAQVSGIKCLLSNNIDSHVIIIPNNVELIDNNEKSWREAILDDNNYKRNEDVQRFNEHNLNIDIEYKKLENNYLSVKGVL